MKKILFLIFYFYVPQIIFSQEKENSIFFTEIALTGVSVGDASGGHFFASLNYQKNKNIYAFRYLLTTDIQNKYFYLMIPFSTVSATSLPVISKEYSLLYGNRYVKNDFAYSYGVGFSLTSNYLITYQNKGKFYETFSELYKNTSLGIPFEFNIQWFKSKKKRIKLIELFPVGKPTGFGGALGIKIFGNISKRSYIGLGITMGLGYYKNYN